MKKLIVSLLKVAFVIFTTYTIVATSGPSKSNEILKTWTVNSNCTNAIVTTETMTSSNYGTISLPENRTYLDYGLPVATIRFGVDPSPISATINSITRSCDYLASTNGTTGKMDVQYSCSDNSVPSCLVLFTAQ